MLLAGGWRAAGGLLAGCWRAAGGLLAGCWRGRWSRDKLLHVTDSQS
jgi:hypothetical protein